MIVTQPLCLSFLLPIPLESQQSQLLNYTSAHTKRGISVSPRRGKIVISRSGSRRENEAGYLDENGAVKDMDGYLNYLALEYDSVWDTKPSWCQPWTISLTGVLIVVISWLVLHSVVVSTLVSILICAWWYIFLYSYPKQYADMIAERRRKITEGLEDTYGSRKGQSS